jgi:ribonuclease HII
MFYYERAAWREGFQVVIGVDEVGRGPLAGPVVAVALWLASFEFKNKIKDSKLLSHLQRKKAYEEIKKKAVIGVGMVSERLIDYINIFNATRYAMELAVLELLAQRAFSRKKIFILLDGILSLNLAYPHKAIIKGDKKSISIACASIVAKVIRDEIMEYYHRIYPQYNFLKNKGYATREHLQALKRWGPSPIHRESFLRC